MTSTPKLLIRADASGSIGFGHVMRCLAIAQEWIRRFGHHSITLASRDLPPVLRSRARSEGLSLLEVPHRGAADEANAIRREGHQRFVIVDGYTFDHAYRQEACRGAIRSLQIDDLGFVGGSGCDLVLNQNLHANSALYPDLQNDCLLLGPRYCLLRSAFRRQHVQTEHPDRVLVCLGATDVLGLTVPVVETLQLVAPNVSIDVVTTSANPRLRELRAALATDSVRLHVDVDHMELLFARAALAVVAAGSIVWEAAACGVPICCVATAENQKPLARSLVNLGAACELDPDNPDQWPNLLHELVSSGPLWERLRATTRQLVNPHGAALVVDRLLAVDISMP